jgi:hypothetical protein
VRELLFEDDPLYLARHPELSPEAVREHRHQRFWQLEVVLEVEGGQSATLGLNVGV